VPRPEGAGEIDDVRPRQELAQAEQIGEFGGGQPGPALDDDPPGEGQDAAEAGQAGDEEALEQGGMVESRRAAASASSIGARLAAAAAVPQSRRPCRTYIVTHH